MNAALQHEVKAAMREVWDHPYADVNDVWDEMAAAAVRTVLDAQAAAQQPQAEPVGFRINATSQHHANAMADVLERMAHALRQGAETRGGLWAIGPMHIEGWLEVLPPREVTP